MTSQSQLERLRAQRSKDIIALAAKSKKLPSTVFDDCDPPVREHDRPELLAMFSGRELAWASWSGVPVHVPAKRYRGAPAIGSQVTANYLPERTIVTYCTRYLIGAARVPALKGYTYYSPLDPVNEPGLHRPPVSKPNPAAEVAKLEPTAQVHRGRVRGRGAKTRKGR